MPGMSDRELRQNAHPQSEMVVHIKQSLEIQEDRNQVQVKNLHIGMGT